MKRTASGVTNRGRIGARDERKLLVWDTEREKKKPAQRPRFF